MTKLSRLERYTERHRQEVLLITVDVAGEPDQVMIFRGFSSSLMRPTAFDPDVPVLPESATILTIDRLLGPYSPDNPHYLQQGLTWETMQPLLEATGV